MYLQSDNGGYGVLISNGTDWFYWSEYHLPVDLDGETDAENADIIRDAIACGEMYDVDDFVNECENEDIYAERIIPAYHGMNIDEIDRMENGGRDCDFIKYIEIK